jgi:hypothetical protein
MLHEFIGLLEEDEISYSWFQQDGHAAHTANNSMKFLNEFSEKVSSLEIYGPFARRNLLHQTFICGEQQNMKCTVIAHVRLMS